MPTVALTCGDINGVGPEIAVKSLMKFQSNNSLKFVFFIPEKIFSHYYKLLRAGFDFDLVSSDIGVKKSRKKIIIYNLGNASPKIGKPTLTSGRISFKSIMKATEFVKAERADVLVTSPISKESFAKTGINFPGHTELLGSQSGGEPLMTFLSPKFKAALATIHLPLSEAVKLLSIELLEQKIKILINALKVDFGINSPRIAVLGVNPHAGENGTLGREEIDIISPAVKKFRKYGAFGPFVPDAFFANRSYENYHAVLGMYHDQVLIPFKMLNFYSGVNYTAGLAFVRTSPDHGTAFDIAGKGIADPRSIIQAVQWAVNIFKRREKFAKR